MARKIGHPFRNNLFSGIGGNFVCNTAQFGSIHLRCLKLFRSQLTKLAWWWSRTGNMLALRWTRQIFRLWFLSKQGNIKKWEECIEFPRWLILFKIIREPNFTASLVLKPFCAPQTSHLANHIWTPHLWNSPKRERGPHCLNTAASVQILYTSSNQEKSSF